MVTGARKGLGARSGNSQKTCPPREVMGFWKFMTECRAAKKTYVLRFPKLHDFTPSAPQFRDMS